ISGPPSPLIENYLRETGFWHRVYHHFGGRTVTIGITGGWARIHRLRDTFPELGNDSTEVERIRYAKAYIFEIIKDYSMPVLS
ncbi:hypothetical protein Gotur_003120, partial [Gossypium turneri]